MVEFLACCFYISFLRVILGLLRIKSFLLWMLLSLHLLFFLVYVLCCVVVDIGWHLVVISRKFLLFVLIFLVFWRQFAIYEPTVLIFKFANNEASHHLLLQVLLEVQVFLFICFVLLIGFLVLVLKWLLLTFLLVKGVSTTDGRDNLIGNVSATILIHL